MLMCAHDRCVEHHELVVGIAGYNLENPLKGDASRAASHGVLYCTYMVQTDIERLSRLMLDEFKRVHERFDSHDDHFDNIDAELRSIRAELKGIRFDLDDLREKVENIVGYRKEIDHAIERISIIEKRLGMK